MQPNLSKPKVPKWWNGDFKSISNMVTWFCLHVNCLTIICVWFFGVSWFCTGLVHIGVCLYELLIPCRSMFAVGGWGTTMAKLRSATFAGQIPPRLVALTKVFSKNINERRLPKWVWSLLQPKWTKKVANPTVVLQHSVVQGLVLSFSYFHICLN